MWGERRALPSSRRAHCRDLRNQVRAPKGGPEDIWLSKRLAHRPGAKMANKSLSLTFSGEIHTGPPAHVKPFGLHISESEREKRPTGGEIDSDTTAAEGKDVDWWREGFYEPMGYHTGDNGRIMHRPIWGTVAMDYCPEVKMIFEMDAEEYVPGGVSCELEEGSG